MYVWVQIKKGAFLCELAAKHVLHKLTKFWTTMNIDKDLKT